LTIDCSMLHFSLGLAPQPGTATISSKFTNHNVCKFLKCPSMIQYYQIVHMPLVNTTKTVLFTRHQISHDERLTRKVKSQMLQTANKKLTAVPKMEIPDKIKALFVTFKLYLLFLMQNANFILHQ
jgi:hypothetical protein